MPILDCAVPQVSGIKKFVSENTLVRPAYFMAVDHHRRLLIWGFRWGDAGDRKRVRMKGAQWGKGVGDGYEGMNAGCS